jgi:PAS domain S-box-containing protein
LIDDGGVQERYFDILMSPVLSGTQVAGVWCAAIETTPRVQAARRASMLAELGARTAAAPTEEAAWAAAAAALQRDPADLPYALLYAADSAGGAAILAGRVGLPLNSPRAPQRIERLGDSPWPLAAARRTHEPVLADDAVVCPLVAGGALCGYFIAGVNPRQPLDDGYRGFLIAAAAKLSEGIGVARLRDAQAQREAALERGRRRLEQRCAELTRLYEHAPIPILVVRGRNFVVERVNDAALASSEGREVLGKPLFDAMPELVAQGFAARLTDVLETGTPHIGREVVVRLERNGRLEDRYFTFVSSPLDVGSDADPRIIIVATDVTEQVRSRAALEASEASYRNIFDGVDVSIWVEDVSSVLPMLDELTAAGVDDLREFFARHPDYLHRILEHMSVIDVNDATLRMFGARDKEDLMRSIRRVFVAESWQAFAEMLIGMYENRSLVRTDAVVATLAGERRELMITVAPTADGARPTRALVTMADITERKRMEQALRESDRQKDEFLATLAHELRNPLAPLRSSVDLLRAVSGAPEAVLDIIERQVEYLVRLAEDLFESSRIRRGAYDLRKERLELGDVLRDAVQSSGPQIQAGAHELDVQLPDEPLWVDGDRMRLSQIFANLLNNAARYTREPGRIVVRAARRDDYVEVAITDTGVGIAADAIPQLFTMFGRLRGEGEAEVPGLGIGLALSKQLAEMHGGTIEAQSEGRGKGSTFVVRLPVCADPGRAPPAPAEVERSIEGRKILVVEDDRDTAESLRLVLEANGAEVRVASTGPKALATFGSFEPEAVLLDIGLPGMDGYEVARRLRAEFPNRAVPIIALTGWGRDEDVQRARDAGFDDHLVKPVDIRALRRLLTWPVNPSSRADESRAAG